MSRDLVASKEQLERAVVEARAVRDALERQVRRLERSWRRQLVRVLRGPIAPNLRFGLGLCGGFMLGVIGGALLRIVLHEL
jgi:hypothetical protein